MSKHKKFKVGDQIITKRPGRVYMNATSSQYDSQTMYGVVEKIFKSEHKHKGKYDMEYYLVINFDLHGSGTIFYGFYEKKDMKHV